MALLYRERESSWDVPAPPGGNHAFAVFKPLQQLPRLLDQLDSSRPIAVYSRQLSQPDLRRLGGAPASDM